LGGPDARVAAFLMENGVLSITYHFYVTKGVVINDMIKTYYKPIVAQKGLIRDKFYAQDTSTGTKALISSYLLSRGYNKSPKWHWYS
jgi:hypothetical protein